MIPDSIRARYLLCILKVYVLYNIDPTNLWGDYLLVVNVTTVRIYEHKTYTVLLLGLKKENKEFTPRNLKIKMTPEYAKNIPFLKYVGHCNFFLNPILENIEINIALTAIYSSTDLRKFNSAVDLRKPRKRKYDKDGKLVIKKAENEQ